MFINYILLFQITLISVLSGTMSSCVQIENESELFVGLSSGPYDLWYPQLCLVAGVSNALYKMKGPSSNLRRPISRLLPTVAGSQVFFASVTFHLESPFF
jgi:hypothetical protein